jgi:hypothetical protein
MPTRIDSMWLLLLAIAIAIATPACDGTAGGQVVDFEAVASGPSDAVAGQTLAFEGDQGWQITLIEASLHIGALYLASDMEDPGAQSPSCILPGEYVAQVVRGRDIDLLSNEPQVFPELGHGSTVEARAGQVWLTSEDVNLADTPTPATVILHVLGSARREAEERPFRADLTIASNRLESNGGAAFESPICKERIVSPIPAQIRVESSGALWLRIDPRRLFTNVDFGALEEQGAVFVFKDDSSDQPSAKLYDNLKQAGPLYDFSWVARLP